MDLTDRLSLANHTDTESVCGRVAIITRTKNRTLLLERALKSVLSQTYTNWRLVIVNDGGDVRAVHELVDMYADSLAGRVLVLDHEIPVGMETAANHGIQAVDSEYVVIHDDDDSWAPNFLLMCVNELRRVSVDLPSVKGVVCYSQQVMERVERGVIITEWTHPLNNWIPRGLISLPRMAEQNFFPQGSFLYRRDVFDTVGLYDESLLMHGDWDFNLRFLSQYDIVVLPYALAFYHVRPDATGEVGNVATNRRLAREGYEQYLRNELLRRDMRTGAASIGTIVLLAWQFGGVHSAIREQGGLHSGTPLEAEGVGQRGRLRWIIASAIYFLRSYDKKTLLTKFVQHWRKESPRRALAVVARWGYLALGGK